MARAKKRAPQRRTRRAKSARKKAAPKKKRVAKRKPVRRARLRRTAPSRKKKAKRRPARKKGAKPARRSPGLAASEISRWEQGPGPDSAGQSGDIQGLTASEIADSESVEELAEEGQAFEAELIDAVENAPEGEVRTREVPEDDVPEEYLDKD